MPNAMILSLFSTRRHTEEEEEEKNNWNLLCVSLRNMYIRYTTNSHLFLYLCEGSWFVHILSTRGTNRVARNAVKMMAMSRKAGEGSGLRINQKKKKIREAKWLRTKKMRKKSVPNIFTYPINTP